MTYKKRRGGVKNISPVYRNLLIAAIAIFVIGTAFALSDIYHKIGTIEHAMAHKAFECSHGADAHK